MPDRPPAPQIRRALESDEIVVRYGAEGIVPDIPGRSLFAKARRAFAESFARPAEGQGVASFSLEACAIDYGGYAVLYKRRAEWGGVSGATGPPRMQESKSHTGPTWLMRLLTRTVDAADWTENDDREFRLGDAGLKSIPLEDRPSSSLVVLTEGPYLTRVSAEHNHLLQWLDVSSSGVSLADFNWEVLPDKSSLLGPR